MKKVILMRHAKSSWKKRGLSDHSRPLNKRGNKAALLMGEFINSINLIPDLVVCSTAMRTKKTIQLIDSKINKNIKIVYDERIYYTDEEGVLDIIKKQEDDITSIMIVGHNPTMEFLTEELIDSTFNYNKFSTCALAVIDFKAKRWQDINKGEGQLALFKTPKMLE